MNRWILVLVGLAVATSAIARSDGRKPVFKPGDRVLEQKDGLGKIAQMFGMTRDELVELDSNRLLTLDELGLTPDELAWAKRAHFDPLLQEPWHEHSRKDDALLKGPWREPNCIDLQQTRRIGPAQ